MSVYQAIHTNTRLGASLFELGIRFFEHSPSELDRICAVRRVDVDQLSKQLAPAVNSYRLYDLDLLMAYLRKSHARYIKKKLPYFSSMIQSLKPCSWPESFRMVKDIQTVFPLFHEDFIHHIYEEEDTLFTYIQLLTDFSKTGKPTGQLLRQINRQSISAYALHHEHSDDDMAGLRQISGNYQVNAHTPLTIRVLFAELQEFESELLHHASLENDVLFPAAMALENEAKKVAFRLSGLN